MEKVILDGLEYERGGDGEWYDLDAPARDGEYWVGGPLDDSPLIAALDEIERLTDALSEIHSHRGFYRPGQGLVLTARQYAGWIIGEHESEKEADDDK
jgi:hypothetical protein